MHILKNILEKISFEKVIGNIDREVGIPIKLCASSSSKTSLMWASPKFNNELLLVNKGIVICEEIKDKDVNSNVTYLITTNPRLKFQELLTLFYLEKPQTGIHDSADINSNVRIHSSVTIFQNVVIEDNCILGENVIIGANTIIHKGTKIGDNVKIGANNVIGGVGFGYEKNEEGDYKMMPHLGNVVLKDNVEVGNCTCIDRAVLGSTILEENVKVDNLVHIAHGVIIGKNSLIIANAVIAGSVTIGKNVWVAPSSSIINKVEIKDNAVIGLGAVVLKDVDRGKIIVGNPGKVLD